MSYVDPVQEFAVLAETLAPRKQQYLTLIASGYTEDDAAQRCGMKDKESVRVSWAWRAKDNETFKRCLELAREHPAAVEPLKLKLLRAATLDSLTEEVMLGRVDPKNPEGPRLAPRTGVLEIAAGATKLVDTAPSFVQNQLNVIVQQGMSALAEEMVKQLQQINTVHEIPSVQAVHALLIDTEIV